MFVLATAAGMAILMLEMAAWLRLPGVRPDQRDDRLTQVLLGGFGFAATLCFYPVLKAFSLGQVQVWLNAAFVFACIALLRDRRALCGALLGASTLMKPQMSLFLAWAVLRGDWRMAAGWAAVVVPGVAVATLLYGFAPMIDYLDVLLFIGRHGESYHVNQTVNGWSIACCTTATIWTGRRSPSPPTTPWCISPRSFPASPSSLSACCGAAATAARTGSPPSPSPASASPPGLRSPGFIITGSCFRPSRWPSFSCRCRA
ncbi:DUF2029 domain-containing protein [Azospirillum sp. INR13]|uniref:glycosyltransferase family 87 protein n=1 Tax=Azospirillum sp. INR13 TaxID=2596919 RepID=UPI00189248E1|nr:glycosyltransferase family 87 protein [Azospirillum sp. INR13]MBF5095574.1 DUF2029 domain-containing protein [Azospirillum sp. INR13]